MAAPDNSKQLEAQKRNKPWFERKMAEVKITKSYLAERLGLDPSIFSRSLHGGRPWRVDELSILSRELHVDVDELYGKVGISKPYRVSKREAKITHKITASGALVPLRATDRDSAPLPPFVPDHVQAAYCDIGGQTGASWYDNWTVYYLPVDQVDMKAIGKLSVVQGEAGPQVGFLRPGKRADQFSLVRWPSGKEDDDMPILGASPVLWIRCQP